MKKISCLLVSILIGIIFIACSKQAPVVEKENKPTISVESREQLLVEWLEAAHYVAEQTRDPQAAKILEFVREHGAPAIPSAEGILVPQEALNDKKGFGIIAALDGDEKLDEYLGKLIANQHVGASFNPDNRMLVIRGAVKMTKTFKGLLMLHECAHAYAYLSKKNAYDWKNPRIFSNEERKVHEFQNRLTDIMGGPEFVKLIDKEVEEIEIPKDLNLTTQIVVVHNKGIDVSKFFGPPLSEFETNFRGTSLAIEVNFKLLERKFKGDIQEKKAISLFSRYSETGIVPTEEDK